ncbi:MAG: patatin-like phospholipase family protein [Desulfuromonadales bacterium]|nr:patatin-like phospholipase family protein [Desulfuromonadales bacterium]
MKTAFVFAGGGSLGAIQVGMLKALVEHGVKADLLVGSSVGAINAAYFAAEPSSHGISRLEAIWLSLHRDDVFHFSWVRGIKGLLGKRTHLFDEKTFEKFLAERLSYQEFHDAVIPIHIIASDFVSGEEVILSKGKMLPALQASAAIPGIFPPVEIDGRYLIDGGVANHTPVSTAIRLGASRLIVLPTGFTCTPSMPPTGALNIALHALNLVIARQLLQDLEAHKDQAEILVVPPLCPQKTHPLDFHSAELLIKDGYTLTRQWLEQDGLKRCSSFECIMLHRHNHTLEQTKG